MRMVFPHATDRLIDFTSDINQFVESFLGGDETPGPTKYAPRMDIVEDDERYVLSLDLPGVNPEDVSVEINEEVVSIHGTRQSPYHDEGNGESKRRIERTYGEFHRSVKLPKAVDRDAVSAHYEHGVLMVWLPKQTPSGSRRISISVGSPKIEGESEAAESES